MNWRPEGWGKIKTQEHNNLMESKGKGHWPTFDDDYMEAGADAMLEATCEEIEKGGLLTEKERIKAVGRFYSGGSFGLERLAQAQLYKILSLLRPIENPVGSVDKL